MAGRKRYKCGTCGEMRSYDDLAEFSFSGVHILCFECSQVGPSLLPKVLSEIEMQRVMEEYQEAILARTGLPMDAIRPKP